VTAVNAFFGFMASSAGRGVRIVAGVVLLAVGLVWVQGLLGWILAIIGLVPLGAGVFDRCVIAPLFGLPFAGPALRKAVSRDPSINSAT
jgi:Zn-dependent membrane protease YugP